MKTAPYNPDARINAKARSANASDTRAKGVEYHDDAVRTFSAWELAELRLDLLALPDSLRRDRFLTLIDIAEGAEGFSNAVSDALSGDADLEGLEQKITAAEDNMRAELDPDTSLDDLGERLLTVPGAELDKIKPVVAKWYGEQLERIRKELTQQIGALNTWRVDAQKALESIQNTDW
jgi:hypothetical protein